MDNKILQSIILYVSDKRCSYHLICYFGYFTDKLDKKESETKDNRELDGYMSYKVLWYKAYLWYLMIRILVIKTLVEWIAYYHSVLHVMVHLYFSFIAME